jgi:hypothetical protein
MRKGATSKRGRFSRVRFVLREFGVLVVGLSVVLLDLLRELFLSAEIQHDDERRLHDSDLSGELNHRTGRLDAGTDPYGWYDD